jgi:hypothetical protein
MSVIFLTLMEFARAAQTPAPLSVKSNPKADSTIENKINVSLFSQPCMMLGPVAKDVLESLHSISPEKIRPDLSVMEMEKIKAKAAKATGFDPGMTLYRDHLVKRLSAKISFDSSLKQLEKKKGGKPPTPDVLLQNVKEHISPIRFTDFKARIESQFKENKGLVLNKVLIQKLKDEYEQFIQPDTEEEFHKMIKSSQIRYECHFGEEADSEEEES